MNVLASNLRRTRGVVLLNVLILVVIVSIMLVGMTGLMVSDYGMIKTENNYAMVLEVAEAGVNYELRKISVDATTADQKHLTGAAGTTYTTSAGTFSVYVTQRNSDGSETTPWVAGSNLWIYSSGTLNGVTRTVKVAALGSGTTPTGNYAVFGVSEGIINGTPTFISSDVGTNGFFTFNGHPGITGSVIFNGVTSNWQSPPNGSYNVVHNLLPLVWPTVESLAVGTFGVSGLSYVAAHNDNALASPAISNNMVLTNGSSNQTFVGKAGGANYYLTSLTMNGSSQVLFDNTAGPITIWVGPSGSSSTFVFSGGTAAIKMSSDPTKAVRIYIATNNDVQLNGNTELDAGLYNVNLAGSGRIIFNGNPAMYGTIVANKFTFNGNPQVHAVGGYFAPTGTTSYYKCVQPWTEVGGVN